MTDAPTPSFRDRLTAMTIAAIAVIVLFTNARMTAKAELIDFAAYWSAARRFTQNPYDVAAVSEQQAHLAITREGPLVMRNPPWTALFFIPLSVFSYPTASGI